MELQHKAFPVSAFKVLDTEQGLIEAVVSVFNNVDVVNERVLPGAFAKSLSRKLPKGVWMHDWNQPVAKTLAAEEVLAGDPRLPPALSQLGGLYIKGQFNMGTQRGREGFSDIAFGIVDEFSIGYMVVKATVSADSPVTDLVELDLYEWSPVLVGANPATALISAKSPLAGLKYADELMQALAAVQSVAARTKRLSEVRRKEGRQLSAANVSRLESIHAALQSAHEDLGKMLEATRPADEGKALIDGSHLVALYLADLARQHGVNTDG